MFAAAASWAGRHRVVLLLVLLFATAWAALFVLHVVDEQPLVWPAAGLVTGLAVVVVHQRQTASRVAEDTRQREATHRALVAALDHERSAVDRLRELERVKGDFVATVGHELRTPITSMVGYLELLEDGVAGELTDGQLDLLGRVQRNARRLHLLVEDLLMLSEIEARRMTITRVPTDLCAVVRRAYDAARPLVEGRTLEVSLKVPDQPVPHDCDPDQLERALLNLLSNAVKFTRDGGRVEIRLEVRGPHAEVVVSDTGIGILAHEQEHVFTRFWRSSVAYDEAIQGTGLGLVIAQAIVTHHDGRIAIASEEGAGTTVTTTLPCTPVAAAPAGLSVAG
ncbi:hypothetical protein EKO23_01475 [Nocardioides guangzhouensis]|uniref:histidine kinase n=1 Tax=Nocardioides guangzhouensis TaxID=2497878 RepID=A0A4Q4ZKL3_9ACTN|nr:ATP-binding protein [Nocardioides guangzhouensis]RYP88588.1 hypothetical protein EKO23_01475 [Nocardioides guangzhouensis]